MFHQKLMNMNFEKLLAELQKNCEGKERKLKELLVNYELCCIGYEMQEKQTDEIYNRVLEQHEFFAEKGCNPISKGERILDQSNLWLLSDADFNHLLELAKPIFVAEKLTDENGFYLTDWCNKKLDARQELINEILGIIPQEFTEILKQCAWNITYGDKLIEIFKSSWK